ncbi:MAG: sugar nucleotide-binding protein, partial [Actinomycetota bacterium]
DPSRAIFVPRGVGNSYQTLTPDTAYSYLVNDHWSPDTAYTFLNLADETAAVDWPIPLAQAELSEKDKAHPRLVDVVPVAPKRILILGADGQVGRALRVAYGDEPHIEYAARADLSITDPDLAQARHWRDYGVIINAAAFTAVDSAETQEGRAAAWQINAEAVAHLARIAAVNGITLVHISSDYVFDGEAAGAYSEDDVFSPLGVYGQSKAAGDLAVTTVPQHYIVRTSWVIGDGANFVRTMASLAEREVDPRVVDDQVGRLTFAGDLADGIRHLVDTRAPYGTYNVTGAGAERSWADVARDVFRLTGHDPVRITGVSTDEYYSGATAAIAPRPRNSMLDLSKITETGFHPRDGSDGLTAYLRGVS